MYRLFGKNPNYRYIQKMIFVFENERRRSSGPRHSGGEPGEEQGKREASDEPKSLMDIDFTQKVDSPGNSVYYILGIHSSSGCCILQVFVHASFEKCTVPLLHFAVFKIAPIYPYLAVFVLIYLYLSLSKLPLKDICICISF
jgi:hypothetical protein